MGRHSSTATVGDLPAHYEQLDVYVDQPPERVDVGKLMPFGYMPAIVLALIGFIDKAENAIIGGVLEQLKAEFGFTDALAGVLFSAPSFAAILLLVPAGIFADTKRRKDILVIVLIVWSVLSFGSAAATSLVMFFIIRLMIGTAAPLNVPATASLIGDFYPLRSRTRAFSIVRATENAGLPVGTLVGSVVGELVGWRAAFIVVGIPGLILAVFVKRMLREPRRGLGDDITAISGDDRLGELVPVGAAQATETVEPPQFAPAPPPPPPYRPEGAPPPYAGPIAYRAPGADSALPIHDDDPIGPAAPAIHAAAVPPGAAAGAATVLAPPRTGFGSELSRRLAELLMRLRQIFAIETVRRLVLGEAILFASFAGIFAFAVSFFARFYFDDPATTDTVETAYAGVLVSLGSVPAIFGGAYLASYIDSKYSKNNPQLRVRVSLLALLTGAAAIACFILVEPLVLRTAFFYVFAGVNIMAVANIAAATADVIPARIRGSGFAVLQICLAIGGSFGPLIVGVSSAITDEDLRWGYAALLVPLLIGAYLIATAAITYKGDSEAVVIEAGGGPALVDPLEGTGTNTSAVRALVCVPFCVLLVPLAPIIGIVGIVFGSKALKEIKARPQYGRGIALTAIWLNVFLALGGLILIRALLKN